MTGSRSALERSAPLGWAGGRLSRGESLHSPRCRQRSPPPIVVIRNAQDDAFTADSPSFVTSGAFHEASGTPFAPCPGGSCALGTHDSANRTNSLASTRWQRRSASAGRNHGHEFVTRRNCGAIRIRRRRGCVAPRPRPAGTFPAAASGRRSVRFLGHPHRHDAPLRPDAGSCGRCGGRGDDGGRWRHVRHRCTARCHPLLLPLHTDHRAEHGHDEPRGRARLERPRGAHACDELHAECGQLGLGHRGAAL